MSSINLHAALLSSFFTSNYPFASYNFTVLYPILHGTFSSFNRDCSTLFIHPDIHTDIFNMCILLFPVATLDSFLPTTQQYFLSCLHAHLGQLQRRNPFKKRHTQMETETETQTGNRSRGILPGKSSSNRGLQVETNA